jgi:endoglucanase
MSVSGAEQEAIRFLRPRLEAVCDSVEVTSTGNITAVKKGAKPGPKAMLGAHLDEIGFGVKSVTRDGFIKFEKIGDFSEKVIPARKVWVQTKTGRIPGVIGMRAGHLLSPEEKLQAQKAHQSYIDVGAASKEEAEGYGVFVGAKIVLQSELMEMANPDIVCARGIDNKIGCALILNILENLKAEDFAGEVVGAFNTLEEVTVAGAFPLYDRVRPDYAVVIDTVPCGDVPDIDTDNELPVYLGKGPAMIVTQGDPSVLRFNMIHPALRKALDAVSEDMQIKMQELALSERAYITEESLTFMGGGGVPAATVAIPRRYSHTPVEVLNLNDAVLAYELLVRLLRRNGTWDIRFD